MASEYGLPECRLIPAHRNGAELLKNPNLTRTLRDDPGIEPGTLALFSILRQRGDSQHRFQ